MLLGGVGIASSDIMSYQMCIVLFIKKKNKEKNQEGRGVHVNQCSNCLICWCLYSGFWAAGDLKVDQIMKEWKKNLPVFFTFLAQYKVLLFLLSFLTFLYSMSELPFFSRSQLFPFILYWYSCCALALLWCLLVEPVTPTPGGEQKGTELWSKDRFFFVLVHVCFYSYF